MIIKGKKAHRSFHSVVVMVRPSVSVVTAERFCCSSREMKELPGMCGFVNLCAWERGVDKWIAKWTETEEMVWLYIPSSRSGSVRVMMGRGGGGGVYVCGCIMFALLIFVSVCFCVTSAISHGLCILYAVLQSGNLFVHAWWFCTYAFCVVKSSICNLNSEKRWPTFSCAPALCSGWVGVYNILYMMCMYNVHLNFP